VSLVYVDTSALGRLLLDETEKPLIEQELEAFARRAASSLLRVELRRLGLRHNLLDRVDPLLDGVLLVPLGRRIITTAETLTPSAVATLDAIHLATAVRLSQAGELDAMMTYDKQLAAGAREHGITVLSPA
jgi:predicted nucleic acid-binding protein